MIKLGIPANPGETIDFRVSADIYGDRISPIMSFTVPKFPPLITFSTLRLIDTPASTENYTNKQYGITAYRSQTTSDRNRNKVSLKLNSVNNLTKNDRINITSTSGPLTALNGNNYSITEVDVRNQRIVFLVPKNVLGVGSGSVNATFNSVSEIVGGKITKGKRYTLSIDKKFFNSLLYTEYAKDILIFSYIQSKDKIDTGDTKRLMSNNDTINELTPPSYSTVLSEYGKRQSYTKFLSDDNGANVEFYIAVARYIQVDGVWTRRWLHQRANKTAIWAKAPKAV